MQETKRSYRIAVLAHGLRAGGGISVGRNILAALARVAPHNEYFCTVPAGLGYEQICESIPRVHTYVYSHHGGRLVRWWHEGHLFPKLVREFEPDLAWSLSHRGLYNAPCPQAILVHLPHLVYPKRHWARRPRGLRFKARHARWHFRRQLRHIPLVFCQTPVMKQRLIDTYRYSGRVELCPNAVSQFTMGGGDGREMPEPLSDHADRMRLFCLSRYYPHKNVESIAAMFERYSEALRDVTVVMTLDPDRKDTVGFRRRISPPPLSDHIVDVGPLDQTELGRYFTHCHGLLLPTLLESFSGTYLEAMHFGTPILTSDLDFARWACGDAALYFDPWHPAAMRDVILRLRDEPDLTAELAAKGRQRLSTAFRSWDDIVRDAMGHLTALVEDRP